MKSISSNYVKSFQKSITKAVTHKIELPAWINALRQTHPANLLVGNDLPDTTACGFRRINIGIKLYHNRYIYINSSIQFAKLSPEINYISIRGVRFRLVLISHPAVT